MPWRLLSDTLETVLGELLPSALLLNSAQFEVINEN